MSSLIVGGWRRRSPTRCQVEERVEPIVIRHEHTLLVLPGPRTFKLPVLLPLPPRSSTNWLRRTGGCLRRRATGLYCNGEALLSQARRDVAACRDRLRSGSAYREPVRRGGG